MTSTTSQGAQASPGTTLRQRYDDVRQRLDRAARRDGRRGSDIVLVAVTKFASFDQIRDLIELGHVDFGENRVQQLVQRSAQVDEFLQRARQLGTSRMSKVPAAVRWHVIGTLQRNKVRKVLPLVRLIHSVDSLRLAEEIQAAAGRRDESLEILIQVNTSGEKSKHGVAPAAVRHLIEQIDTMVNLKVRGLMTMAPLPAASPAPAPGCTPAPGRSPGCTPEDARPTFQRCRELFDDICKSSVADDAFNLLSMGMSGDFEVAIECGANVVRVGTAIFGAPEEATGDAAGDDPEET